MFVRIAAVSLRKDIRQKSKSFVVVIVTGNTEGITKAVTMPMYLMGEKMHREKLGIVKCVVKNL